MLKNNAEFSAFDLKVIFHKDNQLQYINDNFQSSGVMTDSRLVVSKNIFVALKGEKFDGHNNICEAFDKGAAAALVSAEWYEANKDKFPNSTFIIVKDTIEGLGQLAKYHRLRFEDIEIITVAGSNGKTSTKEMIAYVLEQKFNILKTHANFNNQIGVPIMLLQLTNEHNVAVLEIGTNMPGEILTLAKMIQPTYGIITNIGKEHLEQLIDIDGVELEETSMFAELRSKGHALINYDDERLKRYGHVLDTFTTYGEHEHSMIRGTVNLDDNLKPEIDFTWENEDRKFKVKLQTIGVLSAKNAIAAVASGLILGLSDDEIINGIQKFVPLRSEVGYGRMNLEIHQEIKFINDTYNANPSSTESALQILSQFKSENKKIAVLGDMLELGETALIEHQYILSKALEVADKIYLFGENYGNSVKEFGDNSKLNHFENKSELLSNLSRNLQPNDIVLVKGSRGMKMEEVINFFEKN